LIRPRKELTAEGARKACSPGTRGFKDATVLDPGSITDLNPDLGLRANC
jgi:hypothetical protein